MILFAHPSSWLWPSSPIPSSASVWSKGRASSPLPHQEIGSLPLPFHSIWWRQGAWLACFLFTILLCFEIQWQSRLRIPKLGRARLSQFACFSLLCCYISKLKVTQRGERGKREMWAWWGGCGYRVAPALIHCMRQSSSAHGWANPESVWCLFQHIASSHTQKYLMHCITRLNK